MSRARCSRALRSGFRVDLACAGHPPPLVLRAGGGVEEVEARGALLGIEDDVRLMTAAIELRRGDALALYTDGITEARRSGELFGPERLRASVAAAAGRPAAELTTRIQDAVRAFAPGPPVDDQALLVLRASAA